MSECHPKALKRNKDGSTTIKIRLSKEQWALLDGISFDLNRQQCACMLIQKLLWESLEQLLKEVALGLTESKSPN